jgi:hypothetical protein
MEIVEFLNSYANLLTACITMVLAVITGFYVWYTAKIVRIMSKQINADIKISNIILYSDLHKKREWLKQSEELIKDDNFSFVLGFHIFNKNSGSGGIERPKLILEFRPAGLKITSEPITEVYRHEYSQGGGWPETKTIIEDLGKAIYLRGGEIRVDEINYECNLKEKTIKQILKSFADVEFYISYIDNFGKEHLTKIDKVFATG